MFGYTIALTTDVEKFYKVCDHIEKNLGLIGIKKQASLEDVDGTLIQVYDLLRRYSRAQQKGNSRIRQESA